MSSFFIKITACLSMFLDHLYYALPQRHSFLKIIGRIAFPLFAFQMAEGYTHTRDFNRYALRLTVFALLSQYPFSLLMQMAGGSASSLNIFFTLLIGLLSIRAYDTLPCKPAVFAGVLIASEIATLINTDYGQWGVLLIFALFITRKNRIHQCFALIITTLLRYGEDILKTGEISLYAIAVLSTILFILLYNNKKGPKVKYLIYAFYPTHILVLYCFYTLIPR